MLKLFSTRKWLVTQLLLVAAMVMPVTGKAQMTLTYDSSSSGYSNETASNLFDGNTSTKWCYDAPSTSSSAWVVFKANEACRLKVSHMLSHAGTSADPFQISNADDLYWFAAWVNGTYTPAEGETAVTHLDACAVLTNDITVNTGVLNADGTLVSD
ncbi:MAG: hypothetical protein SOZ67_06930, partial [Alloprevotella sp.]|nr:hypothetical protein [Alloprevotella sp.]